MASMYKDESGNWVPVPRPTSLYHVIRGSMLNALAFTDGNQKEAAGLLEISARQFSYMMIKYSIPCKSNKSITKMTRLKLVHGR